MKEQNEAGSCQSAEAMSSKLRKLTRARHLSVSFLNQLTIPGVCFGGRVPGK